MMMDLWSGQVQWPRLRLAVGSEPSEQVPAAAPSGSGREKETRLSTVRAHFSEQFLHTEVSRRAQASTGSALPFILGLGSRSLEPRWISPT